MCEVTRVRSKALLVKKMGSENPEACRETSFRWDNQIPVSRMQDQLSILKNIDTHKMMERWDFAALASDFS